MKKLVLLSLMISGMVFPSPANARNGVWQQLETQDVPFKGKQLLFPERLMAYALNDVYLKDYLFSLTDDVNDGQQIELPSPDGSYRTFVVWQSHLMAPELAAKYPAIKTFTAYALDNPRVVAKLDYTLKGFHAMIFDGNNTYFIDPYSNVNDGFYMAYYKHDYRKPANKQLICHFDDKEEYITDAEAVKIGGDEQDLPSLNYKVLNGTLKRTYDLALATTYEYSMYVDGPTPTKPGVLSAMVTSINRVSGVYELELAVAFQLIGNTDDLIYLTPADPYTNGNTNTMLSENQTNVNAIIGSGNYDIGHLFGTNSGGQAGLGVICSNSSKARGVTGSSDPIGDAFDIDYVAHEIGHQFGGPHTFNSPLGSCAGNRSGSNAYEPGSGTTIMAYAGICGADNLQPHSDAYFHSNSLQRIYNKMSTTSCPTTANTGNPPPGIPAFSATYSIPFLTPFELTAPNAIDSGAVDTLRTYCWEEFDLSSSATSWVNTTTTGPIFRSFIPTESRTRVFPTIQKVVTNVASYLGEKLPSVARTLEFKLAVRSIYQGLGSAHFSDDSIVLNVINTTTPFVVTAPNTNVTWAGGSTQNVTWDVSGTTAAPISCTNVNIYLSVDGGYTYPYVVATNMPNTGTASVTVPNVPNTTTARMKVKGAGNVFFDISNVNFTITFNSSLPPAEPTSVQQAAAKSNDVKIYPVPANDVLHISMANTSAQIAVYNTVGQVAWKGTMNNELEIPVSNWAKGIYYVQFMTADGQRFTKPVVVQ